MVQYNSELKNFLPSFLKEEEARTFLHLMDDLFCEAGEVLFAEDDPAECLYLLLKGKIAVKKRTGFGERSQVVALLDPGAPIGEGGLLERKTRGATLVAVHDSQLLVLKKSVFEQLTRENPNLVIQVLKWLLSRVELRLQKSSERLAHVL